MKKYQMIYADPPWEYGQWNANRNRPNSKNKPIPFPTMTVKEICGLPVRDLTADNCELYLWTTQKYLPQSFIVIQAWGFKYKQAIIWCKKPRAGLGGIYTPSNEFLLLARKGKAPKVKRILSTWFLVKRPHNHHSEKPKFFQDMIEQVSHPPRLELFARRKVEGWDCWGNEVESDIEL